jgi:hypothetical protein
LQERILTEFGKIHAMQGELQKELSLSRASSNIRLQSAQALAIRYLACNNLNKSFEIFLSCVAVKKVLGSYFATKFGAHAKEDGFTRQMIKKVHLAIFTPKTLGRLYFNGTEK